MITWLNTRLEPETHTPLMFTLYGFLAIRLATVGLREDRGLRQNLYAAGPGMLSFRQSEGQDAVFIIRLGFVSIDRIGQSEALLILAFREATPMRGGVFRHAHVDDPLDMQHVRLRG